MTKLGDRLIAGAREAVALAQGHMPHPDVRVTPSCGCVYCDLGNQPVKLRRQYVHYYRSEGRFAICKVKGIRSNG